MEQAIRQWSLEMLAPSFHKILRILSGLSGWSLLGELLEIPGINRCLFFCFCILFIPVLELLSHSIAVTRWLLPENVSSFSTWTSAPRCCTEPGAGRVLRTVLFSEYPCEQGKQGSEMVVLSLSLPLHTLTYWCNKPIRDRVRSSPW